MVRLRPVLDMRLHTCVTIFCKVFFILFKVDGSDEILNYVVWVVCGCSPKSIRLHCNINMDNDVVEICPLVPEI